MKELEAKLAELEPEEKAEVEGAEEEQAALVCQYINGVVYDSCGFVAGRKSRTIHPSVSHLIHVPFFVALSSADMMVWPQVPPVFGFNLGIRPG